MNTRQSSQKRKAEDDASPPQPAAKTIKGTHTSETAAEQLVALQNDAVPNVTQNEAIEQDPTVVADETQDSAKDVTEKTVVENEEAEKEAIPERPKKPKEAISKRPIDFTENIENRPKKIEGETKILEKSG